MKIKSTLLALSLLITTLTTAQKQEVGLFGGVALYAGDLSYDLSSIVAESRLAYGVFYRYNLGEYFSVRGGINRGRVSGSDMNANNGNEGRNLSFETSITEIFLTPEFNIYNFFLEESGYLITPYVTAGIAGFHFNPTAFYQGEWYDLQPLGTEGQGLPGNPELYSKVGFALPIGGGIKLAISDLGSINIEMGFRKTFTDYIDDVSTTYPDITALSSPIAMALSDRKPEFNGIPSLVNEGQTRGNPNLDDWYFFGGISVSILLKGKNPDVPKN